MNLVEQQKLKRLRVKNSDVFLEDYEVGQGKIIISNLDKGSYTFYWGSMGCSLSDFLLEISEDYFAGKLCKNSYEFDAKESTTCVRKYIRTELKCELPYWLFLSAQKEMREAIKELENTSSEEEFVSSMLALPENLICYDLNYQEEKDFKKIIDDVFKCEPWNFIEKKPSREYIWLKEFSRELKNHLQIKK